MKQTALPGGFLYYADGDEITESWNQVQAERQHTRWFENRNNLYQLAADTYDGVSLDADGQGQFAMPLEAIVKTFFGYAPDAPPVADLNASYSDEFDRSWFDKWSFHASYWPAAPAAHSFLRDSYGFVDFTDNAQDWFSINAFPRNMLVFKKGDSSELDTFLGFAPATSAFVVACKLTLGGETGGGRANIFLANSSGEFISHGQFAPSNVDQGPWYIVFARAQGSTTYHIWTSSDGRAFWYEGNETKSGTIARFGLRLTSTNSKRLWATLNFVRVFLGTQKAHTGRNLET
jgi:hypothetical protein